MSFKFRDRSFFYKVEGTGGIFFFGGGDIPNNKALNRGPAENMVFKGGGRNITFHSRANVQPECLTYRS